MILFVSVIFLRLGDQFKSLGIKPVTMILGLADFSLKAAATDIIPRAISMGESLSISLVPAWITMCFTVGGKCICLALQSTCCVLSPPIPKLIALYDLNLFQTFPYLNRPLIIESPIKINEQFFELFSNCKFFRCVAYQPTLSGRSVGVVVREKNLFIL